MLALVLCLPSISFVQAGETQTNSEGETLISQDKSAACKIKCLDPHACCAEAQKVIDLLNLLAKAFSEGDIATYEKYLDDNCTTFDESTHKLVSGKKNVITELMRKFADFAPDGKRPLLSFTIDQPYAKVNGDTCVVTFIAMRELGGKHPIKESSNTTDVFIKKDGQWKKLHYRSHWKKVR
jgi:ketosteroid isomerase-like protein